MRLGIDNGSNHTNAKGSQLRSTPGAALGDGQAWVKWVVLSPVVRQVELHAGWRSGGQPSSRHGEEDNCPPVGPLIPIYGGALHLHERLGTRWWCQHRHNYEQGARLCTGGICIVLHLYSLERIFTREHSREYYVENIIYRGERESIL